MNTTRNGSSSSDGPGVPTPADRLLDQMLARAFADAEAPDLLDDILASLPVPETPTMTTSPPVRSRTRSARPDQPLTRGRRMATARRNAEARSSERIVTLTAAALFVVVVAVVAVWMMTGDPAPQGPDPRADNEDNRANDDATPLADPEDLPPLVPTGGHRVTDHENTDGVWFSRDGKYVAFVANGKLMLGARDLLTDGTEARVVADWPTANRGPRTPGAPVTHKPVARFLPRGGLLVSFASGMFVVDPASGARTSITSEASRVVSISPDGCRVIVSRGESLIAVHIGTDGAIGKQLVLDSLPRGVTHAGCFSDDSRTWFCMFPNPGHIGLMWGIFRVNTTTGESGQHFLGKLLEQHLDGDPEVGSMQILAAHGSGNDAVLHVRVNQRSFWDDPRNQGMSGTHTYGRAPRGRNPGSAEPGPQPPSWEFRIAGAGENASITLLHKRHLARYCDRMLVGGNRDLSSFTFLQMAQFGGAGDARDQQLWLGTINAAGRKTETHLQAPVFPANWRNIGLTVLDETDSGKLLLLVTADVTITMRGEGPAAMMQAMQAGHTVTRLWSDDNGSYAGVPVFGLFVADLAAGTMTALRKPYAERVQALGTDYETVPGAQVANVGSYSRASGVLALSAQNGGAMGANRKPPYLLLIHTRGWETR